MGQVTLSLDCVVGVGVGMLIEKTFRLRFGTYW